MRSRSSPLSTFQRGNLTHFALLLRSPGGGWKTGPAARGRFALAAIIRCAMFLLSISLETAGEAVFGYG